MGEPTMAAGATAPGKAPAVANDTSHETPASGTAGLTLRSADGSPVSRRVLVLGALICVVAVPLLIALAVLRDPSPLSLTDVAQVEMRVRDVGTADAPLVGLGGRLQGHGEWGSHPGPLSFYALAPVYHLLGSTGWALLASAAMLSLVAAGLAIWMGYRRGGWRFAVAVTGVLVLLLRAYEVERIVDAWNPHLPLVWWFVFLLGVWSVLCRDHAMLPIVVFAGTYCAQTHIPYAGLVAGLGILVVAVVVHRAVWAWQDPSERRVVLRWLGVSMGLFGLLWIPPLIDQVLNDPGNLAIIVDNFRNPREEGLAFANAWRQWLARLDVGQLWGKGLDPIALGPTGSLWSGLTLLLVWAASAVLAWRRGSEALIRLHVVVGVALGVGLVSIARLFGPPFPYLMLWAWGTTALATLVVVWTLLSVGRPRVSMPAGGATSLATPLDVPGLRWPNPTASVLGGVALLLGASFAADAASAEMPDAPLSLGLDEMASATAARLDEDPAGCGNGCRYVVTWDDPVHVGSQGYGMLVELERQGFDVSAPEHQSLAVREHRVMDPDDADAIVHVAVTDDVIDEARARPGAEQLAYIDADDQDDPVDRQQVADALAAEGFDELVELALDPRNALVPLREGMSSELFDLIVDANAVYRPSAVFLIPS